MVVVKIAERYRPTVLAELLRSWGVGFTYNGSKDTIRVSKEDLGYVRSWVAAQKYADNCTMQSIHTSSRR